MALILAAGCAGDGVTGGPDRPTRGGTVVGVVTVDGVGTAGVPVTLHTTPARGALTDAQGRYGFDNVPMGLHSMALSPPEDLLFPALTGVAEVTPGREVRVDFQGTLPRTASLQVRVVLEGSGMQEVTVVLSGPGGGSAKTDDEGVVHFPELARGSRELRLVGIDPAYHAFPETVRIVELTSGQTAVSTFHGVRVPRPPAAPAPLRLTALTPAVVQVEWDEVEEAEGYLLERRTGEGGWQEVARPGVGRSPVEDGGLQPGTRYGYRLQACNGDGCSSHSPEAEVVTPLKPPTAPVELTAVPLDPNRIRLDWRDLSDDETEFRLRRRGPEDGWVPLASVAAGVTTYQDQGLPAGTTLRYQVQACGEGGCSEFSNEASASTPDEPPAPPTGLVAEAVSHSLVGLTWTDGAGVVEEVRVERQAAGGVWTAVGSTSGGTGTFQDGSTTGGTSWLYRVRGCNGGGCSPWSGNAAVTTPEAPPAPPTSFAATPTGAQRIHLSWVAVGSPQEFQIQRRPADGSWGALASVPAGISGFADETVTTGEIYGYRIRACSGAGCSTFTAEVQAAAVASELNLSIAAVHLNQVIQTLGGSVPLVAGRSGVLRVFVQASMANDARPDVRVRLYHGASLVFTQVIPAPGGSVPTDPDISLFGSSWNLTVPSALVTPNLRVLVEVDPQNAIPETTTADNVYPASGTPHPLDVRTVPPFRVRFVPVHQSATGLTGSADPGTLLSDAFNLFPLVDADADVRTPYTTAVDTLKSNDSNNAWLQLLSELNTLRVAEGSGKHYYGVVRTNYSSGIAGYGYVGGRTAVGWDRSGSASWVAAHEWGHNFGRSHAPCGVGGGDPGFPYAGGVIGHPGWNGGGLVASSARDLMGYCTPRWISDYTYNAVLQHRAAGAAQGAAAASAGPEPVLILWGRLSPDGRSGVLEPAFQVTAPAEFPSGAGENVLEGVDGAGAVLFRLPFQGDLTGEEDGRHFAFALPLTAFPADRLATIRLLHGSTVISSRTSPPPVGGPQGAPPGGAGGVLDTATRTGDRVELRWDAAATPLLVVRDPASGQILSLARGGAVNLPGAPAELEVTPSDGVRSRSERIRP